MIIDLIYLIVQGLYETGNLVMVCFLTYIFIIVPVYKVTKKKVK